MLRDLVAHSSTIGSRVDEGKIHKKKFQLQENVKIEEQKAVIEEQLSEVEPLLRVRYFFFLFFSIPGEKYCEDKMGK